MAEKTDQAPEGGGKKKLIMIIAIALVVLIGGGAAAFMLMGKSEEELAKEKAEQEAAALASPDVGPMVDIESFIVNILDESGTRYLKAAITLELTDDKVAEEVSQRMPQIRDAVIMLIGNKTFSELQDYQGKMQLRAELTTSLNELMSTGKIKRIYFTDFVVQ